MRRRHNNFDSAFPNNRKYVEEPGRIGVDEIVPLRVTGEVELIARTSYRLGHAESYASAETERVYELEEQVAKLREELSVAERDKNHYRNHYNAAEKEREAIRQQMIEWHDKFIKLDKKLHPAKYKKATAKKESK